MAATVQLRKQTCGSICMQGYACSAAQAIPSINLQLPFADRVFITLMLLAFMSAGYKEVIN
jgi:hypothetical protein